MISDKAKVLKRHSSLSEESSRAEKRRSTENALSAAQQVLLLAHETYVLYTALLTPLTVLCMFRKRSEEIDLNEFKKGDKAFHWLVQ